jgi:hypothetical protein
MQCQVRQQRLSLPGGQWHRLSGVGLEPEAAEQLKG